jgi:hypothetical protein
VETLVNQKTPRTKPHLSLANVKHTNSGADAGWVYEMSDDHLHELLRDIDAAHEDHVERLEQRASLRGIGYGILLSAPVYLFGLVSPPGKRVTAQRL